MSEKDYIENLSESIVREYLSRKGLKRTLLVMDEEMPRTKESISNRMLLAKECNLETLLKKNKEQPAPYRAMLEVMTKDFAGHNRQSGSSNIVPTPGSCCISQEAFSSLHSNPSDSRLSPSSTQNLQQHYSRSKDLVLEDADNDGETVLGAGRQSNQYIQDCDIYIPATKASRNKKSAISSTGGLITSNLDDRARRRMKHPPHRSGVALHSAVDTKLTSNSPLEGNLSSKSIDGCVTKTTGVCSENNSKKMSDANKLNSSHLEHKIPESYADILPTSEINRSSVNGILNKNDPSVGQISIQGRSVQRSPVVEDYFSRKGKVPRQSISNIINGNDVHENADHCETFQNDQKVGGYSKINHNAGQQQATTIVGDVEFGDIDDLDSEFNELELGKPISMDHHIQQSKFSNAKPIDLQTAIDLKMVIFGSANQTFNDEWRYQSLVFLDLPHLSYGILQKKGGPCGVLAAVQACFLQQLLFQNPEIATHKRLSPKRQQKSETLATTLSSIFWRAGNGRQAIVSLSSGSSHFSGGGKYKADNFTETLVLYYFDSYDGLIDFMKRNIYHFETDGSGGVIMVLFSSILSSTVEMVKSDMDDRSNKLMGAHGYCTQEMVNLILLGYAASNVFNDTVELGGAADGSSLILKGIRQRSDVGLLSLFEHYKSCQVGTYLKTPRYPIWVVCSESHFSVLFSTKKELTSDWKAERRFDLYYYDGLARQDEEIKLTIDTTNQFYEPPSEEDELISPLEHCIRTKNYTWCKKVKQL
ncbi:putative ubiquitin carboxyl-terminal hydrolase MINDY-4 isoform X2 [Tubulanus polymorphus]|uniref:putative ubiquitin carboxyl-terminal hydrolase MINDY-4 isoform X2 n=1 Tax=Tubulanus polymorphus TaxID=672921 RepID=UPI003DA64BCC